MKLQSGKAEGQGANEAPVWKAERQAADETKVPKAERTGC